MVSSLDIFDDSDGCGQKLVITVVSGKFTGVSMIQQHRMVNKVKMKLLLCRLLSFSGFHIQVIEVEREDIHAITLKTMTPEKYEKMQAAKTSGV